ncbi:MAG: MogA/MoaB family molybdenum cofactor biosynthesis protein [Bdellovibrionota bacterium]
MDEKPVWRVGVVISSDRAYQGRYEDKTGPAVKAWIEAQLEFTLGEMAVIPDDESALKEKASDMLVRNDVVIVSGGTGLGERDITPQTIEALSDYCIPGVGELLRAESLKYSLNAYLSRCGGWVKQQKLILALAGSPKAASEQLDILRDLLPHLILSLRGLCKHRRRTVEL